MQNLWSFSLFNLYREIEDMLESHLNDVTFLNIFEISYEDYI